MTSKLSILVAPIGKPVAAGVEMLLLPAAMLALGVWLSPDDPLFARTQFPWPWLTPLILALRYGPLPGFGGALCLFLGWYGLEGFNLGMQEIPSLYFLGGLIMVMLAGEFASIWRGRVRRAEATQDYLDRRLGSLTQTHYLLRLSHDQLEQELRSRPVSMRDALTGLRDLTSVSDPEKSLPASDEFLKLAAQFCQIERAALVPIKNKTLQASQAVFLGARFALVTNDPLLCRALNEELLCHVGSLDGDQRKDSHYLVVAPVSDVSQNMHALLIVDALPFFALQDETLHMLNLMLGYYGDSLSAAALVAPIQSEWHACPAAFALELQRLSHLERQSDVPSTLIALNFAANKSSEDLPSRILRQERSLDVTWVIGKDPARPRALLALLPLAGSAAVDGYLARTERWLASQFETNLEGVGISFRAWQIGDMPPLTLLSQVLEECNVESDACALRATA
ncbi:PelD GGDEF domain-containing protein [Uliginosibacterium flavum]|uniref:PelD GGDEF domain-containing protein n=1 Tax=Uliginosibacterium flavum TaxID=1396831 RepID=A0ABV2TIP7_9RHOO